MSSPSVLLIKATAVCVVSWGATAHSDAVEQDVGEPVYEIIRLDLGSPASRYAAAPCTGCLDEAGVLKTAASFLETADIHYIDYRAELLRGFPWRGRNDGAFRFVGDQRPKTVLDRPSQIEYVGDEVPDSGDALAGRDETWRVWYQTGWVSTELIENYVDGGELPLEALAWPPRPIEKFLIVHARTGRVSSLPTDFISDAPDAWIARDRRAKEVAERVAGRILAELESR